MDVGITGPPGSGRSTLFRALLAHRAPRTAGDRHGPGSIGVIHVPDPRLERLAERFQPRKTTPVEIRLHDPCPSLEASFPIAEIEAMKRMDLLLLTLPAFTDPSPEAAVAGLEQLMAELCLEDLGAVERRLARAPREKLEEVEKRALERVRPALEADRPAAVAELSAPERRALRGYALVTDRLMIAVRNSAEAEAGAPPPEALVARAGEYGVPVLSLCARLEAEMADLAPEERPAFLAGYAIAEPAGAVVTRATLERADFVTFFTVSDEECRAWPIPRGTPARLAAGKVHSDMERGFIRAEVISWDDLVALGGGLVEARKLGKLRVEGKDYTVRDGEVVHFRFNV